MREEEKEKIYLISGLGADRRVFQNLKLSDYCQVHIAWPEPKEGESIAAFAAKIIVQIKTETPIIIGLSFGGMVAVELSKQIKLKALILLSSARSRNDLSPLFPCFMAAGFIRLLPSAWSRRSNFFVERMMGAVSKTDKVVLAEILRDTDPHFFRWAMEAIAYWKQDIVLTDLLEIHGTKDRIIPYRPLPIEHTIIGGGHLMVLNRAQEVERIILAYLRRQVKEI